jgi:hypothetical protein
MAVILIDRMIPTAGAAPEEGYDPISLAGFTSWAMGDQALFSVVVPGTYLPGADFALNVQESTASVSGRHAWRVKTCLFRPGMHRTDQPALTETFSTECVAQPVAHQLSVRTFALTGSATAGQVSGMAIEPGDHLSFVLTRVPASLDEDPLPIEVFSVYLDVREDSTAESAYEGRLGRIIDTVRDLFNESGGEFLSDHFIIRAANRCLEELAQDDYWRRETWIPCFSGASRTDLLPMIPDFQALHHVRFNGSPMPMTPLGGYEEFDELKTGSGSSGIPQYYVLQNTILSVWPPPGTDLQSGFCVYHSFLPDPITGPGDSVHPPVPKAHDLLFVYYVLKQAFLRDRHAPGADAKFQEYSALYDRARHALLSQSEAPASCLQPRR